VKRQVREVNHFPLVMRERMSGAIPVLPLYVFVVWRSKRLPLPSLFVFMHVTAINMSGIFLFLVEIHLKILSPIYIRFWNHLLT
jgi:hypothetical protein